MRKHGWVSSIECYGYDCTVHGLSQDGRRSYIEQVWLTSIPGAIA